MNTAFSNFEPKNYITCSNLSYPYQHNIHPYILHSLNMQQNPSQPLLSNQYYIQNIPSFFYCNNSNQNFQILLNNNNNFIIKKNFANNNNCLNNLKIPKLSREIKIISQKNEVSKKNNKKLINNNNIIINNNNINNNIINNNNNISFNNNNNNNNNDNNDILNKKKKRTIKICNNCPHKYAIHYAKGMCSNCYHSKGRIKKPWNCPHTNKTHYALGLCQNCYQMAYIKKNLESKSFKDNNTILNDKKRVSEKKED